MPTDTNQFGRFQILARSPKAPNTLSIHGDPALILETAVALDESSQDLGDKIIPNHFLDP